MLAVSEEALDEWASRFLVRRDFLVGVLRDAHPALGVEHRERLDWDDRLSCLGRAAGRIAQMDGAVGVDRDVDEVAAASRRRRFGLRISLCTEAVTVDPARRRERRRAFRGLIVMVSWIWILPGGLLVLPAPVTSRMRIVGARYFLVPVHGSCR
ncbi:hypothetical protein ACIBEA_39105 [Streptomyces sp. NPDC051555]|uniref:hypothetical protein n=1 Tax=Streptomyces sp. NPDC051555 TaxID=3365657 RepID=UPI003794200F